MKFKLLEESDKHYVRAVHADSSIPWDIRMQMICNRFNVSERTVRRWIKKLGFSVFSEKDSEHVTLAKSKVFDSSKKYHIITWAQNATPIHDQLFDNMLKYAEFLDAEVHVICGRYKNPTSVFSEKQQTDDWWDTRLVPYISAIRLNIHPFVSVLADVKVQPTASDPLMGFEGLTGDSSSIIGHPASHLRSLPVLSGTPHKFLATTGAVTLPNYTDSRAGKKGEFHHTYGFIIIECKNDDTFYLRQVSASPDGSFCDLVFRVDGGTINVIQEIPCFILGDIHAANINRDVFKKTLSFFSKVRPHNVILHDLLDGESISHHDKRDPVKCYAKLVSGKSSLANELKLTDSILNELLPYNPVVVSSNHQDWVDRWINEQDWKKDLENSPLYMELTLARLSGKASKGAYAYHVEKTFGDSVKYLDRDDSFKIMGWELANHGDKGFNGSKGNLTQYSKLSTKVIVGDYHQPGRRLGALSVGTYSKLRMGYNVGPSSWVNGGALIHPNGKAQHILFMDNNFTTFFNGKFNLDS